jgi:hypothetical protein
MKSGWHHLANAQIIPQRPCLRDNPVAIRLREMTVAIRLRENPVAIRLREMPVAMTRGLNQCQFGPPATSWGVKATAAIVRLAILEPHQSGPDYFGLDFFGPDHFGPDRFELNRLRVGSSRSDRFGSPSPGRHRVNAESLWPQLLLA